MAGYNSGNSRDDNSGGRKPKGNFTGNNTGSSGYKGRPAKPYGERRTGRDNFGDDNNPRRNYDSNTRQERPPYNSNERSSRPSFNRPDQPERKPFNREQRQGGTPFNREGQSQRPSYNSNSQGERSYKPSRNFNTSGRPFTRNTESTPGEGERTFSHKPFNKDFDRKREGGNYRSGESTPGFANKFDKRAPRPARNSDSNPAGNSDKPYAPRAQRTGDFKFTNKFAGRKRIVAPTHTEETEPVTQGQPQTRRPAGASEGIRLNRYIANSGLCSRRKADELIEAGTVTVNGQVVTELGMKVNPGTDKITYNGETLRAERPIYVLLNKPKDFITTTDDPFERRTVMQLVANAGRSRMYPVGRLDRNTTGLLLFTNDGALADQLAHPSNAISKLYKVDLDKNLTQGDLNKIAFGLELEDGFVKPDTISYVVGGAKNEIGIQIHSGKNRIVRRIFEHLGYEVVKLDRVVYANLTKKDLPRGKWRYLSDAEIGTLKKLVKTGQR